MRVVALFSYLVFLTNLTLAPAVDAASTDPASAETAAEASAKKHRPNPDALRRRLSGP